MTKEELLTEYQMLNNNKLDDRGNHELVSDLIKIRNEISEGKLDILPNIQAEIDALSFSVKKGKLSFLAQIGNYKPYPTVDLIGEEELTYLKERITKTKNPIMRSRFSHIVWAIGKDYKFAQSAVDAYVEMASIYELSDKNNGENHHGLALRRVLTEAFVVSKQANYKTKEVSDLIEKVIFGFNKQSTSYYAVVINLLELCLEHKKDFDNDFWDKAKNLCLELAKELEEVKNNYFFSRHYIELAGKIDLLVFGNNTNDWNERLAKSYEDESASREDGLAKVLFNQDAIKLYRQAGNKEKAEELAKNHKELVGKVEFTKFELPFDAQPMIDEAEKRLERLKTLRPEEIITELSKEGIVVPYDEAEKAVNEDRQGGISHLFSRTDLDLNRNIARNATEDGEKLYDELLKHVDLHFTVMEPAVITIFKGLLLSGSFTAEDFIEYLKNNCWFGKEYDFVDSGELQFTSRKWIDLLEPAIIRLFEEFNSHLEAQDKGEKYLADSILIIDSLVLKFEGIIREAFELNGQLTILTCDDGSGRTTTREKDINALLREAFAEEVFGKDLTLTLKFVFIERTGFNLRNNVSHTLIQKEHYLLYYVYILIILLLKIGLVEPLVKKVG